jgi:hypothetical protein
VGPSGTPRRESQGEGTPQEKLNDVKGPFSPTYQAMR